ncbi:RND family transporter [Verrucomicrobiota bacterium]
MKLFPNAFAQFILRARFFVLAVCMALTVFFLWVMKDLTVQTRLDDFLPQKHPFLQVQNRLTDTFGGLNQVTIAIRVKEGDILNPETLGKVHRITSKLYLSDGINSGRILSLSSRRMKFVRPTPGGFSVSKVMKTPPETPEEIAQLKQRIVRTPLVYGSRRARYGPIVSKDFKSTLIQADFESDVSSRHIFQHLQKIIDEEKDPNHEIYIAGRPILEGWFDFYLPSMFKVFLVTILIMIVMLYLAFRSKRGVLLPLLSALMSTIWGLGLLVLLGYDLNPGTILVPFLVMALAISHTVQFVKRYYERMGRPNSASYKAAKETLQSLLVPASASLITDALGFLSLLIVPLTLIRSMALAAGTGILSIFITTVTFVPAALSCLPEPRKLEVEREERITLLNRILGGIAAVVTHRRGQVIVMAVFALLALVGFVGARKLAVGDNEPGSALLYPDSPYNRAESYINDKFTGSNPFYIFVEGKEYDALISSDVLKEMESLQKYLVSQIPQAGYSLSLANYIKGLNFTMFNFDPQYLKIPDSDKTIAEYMFLYTCSGFPQDFTPVVDEDLQLANIKVDLKDHRAETINATIKATQDWIEQFHKTDKVNFLYAQPAQHAECEKHSHGKRNQKA